jgi:serine phosphatase RsbU (regulator of sigma subunit)
VEPINRLAQAERAMLRAPSHALAETIRDVLTSVYGATSADLLLIDYRMTVLRSVLDPSARQPVIGSPAGTAFVEQRPVVADGQTFVPMTVQGGDRAGVVALRLAEPADEPMLAELVELAAATAQALVVADNVTDRFRDARRTERLTLAAEMQWQLLPGRALRRAEFTLGGQLEPAYAVRGDTFDWTADADQMTVTVSNGSGDGVGAALLTGLAVYALRNARRAGLGLADQAALADQAVYSQHRGDRHVETLMLRFELATGRVRAVDAGSPQVFRLRGDAVEQIPLEAQLPLGMFDGTVYTEEEFAVQPGDRLFVVSDGVPEATVADRWYGERELERIMRTTRPAPPGEAVRLLLADLMEQHAGEQGLDDDAVAVCVDWTGRAG